MSIKNHTDVIRRNKNGQQNLTDLRRAIAGRTDVRVYSQGNDWIIERLAYGLELVNLQAIGWHSRPLPYWIGSERQAIQFALYGDVESPDETQYYADKSTRGVI